MLISEIFCSINGESARAGKRTVFIRTYGCNLDCSYCDSTYAWKDGTFTEMSIDDIVRAVGAYNCKRVTITGGEPVLQKDFIELVKALHADTEYFYDIEIETNGACDLAELIKLRNDDVLDESVLITMDWKCPSSGCNSKMIESNLALLEKYDVLKCVVANLEDLEEMCSVVSRTRASVYVSPVFGKIEPRQIAEYIIEGELNNITLQLQQHKIIWPSDMRGV